MRKNQMIKVDLQRERETILLDAAAWHWFPFSSRTSPFAYSLLQEQSNKWKKDIHLEWQWTLEEFPSAQTRRSVFSSICSTNQCLFFFFLSSIQEIISKQTISGDLANLDWLFFSLLLGLTSLLLQKQQPSILVFFQGGCALSNRANRFSEKTSEETPGRISECKSIAYNRLRRTGRIRDAEDSHSTLIEPGYEQSKWSKHAIGIISDRASCHFRDWI